MAKLFFVSKDPNVMGGKACIRDTQITISAVVSLLASGHQKDEVIQMFPVLTREDLTEAVAYTTRAVDDPANAQVEIVSPHQEAPADLPKAGPGPLVGTISHIPHRKVPPARPAEQPQEAPQEATSEAASRTPRLEPTGDAAPEVDPEQPSQVVDESIELFHPSFPDKPTVTVSAEGLYDRRWAIPVIPWPDIESIERISGRKSIKVTLRNPECYINAMPFFKRLGAQFKLAFNIPAFHLDTSSLAIRTKDLYFIATRLWHAHRGSIHLRHKRRIRTRKSTRDSIWAKCLPM